MQRLHRNAFATPALIAAGALIGWVLSPADARAQERRVMVVDEGGGPMVFHLTSPDLKGLLRPDFDRDDLPVFAKRLQLDEVQKLVVETLLLNYLEQFDEQIRQQLPEHARRLGDPDGPDGPGLRFAGGDHEHGGAPAGGGMFIGAGEEGMVISELADMINPEAMDVDVEAGAGGVAIGVRAVAGDAGDVADAVGPEGAGDVEVFVSAPTADGQGENAVVVSVATPDGELPEEVKEALAEKARELAERVQARMAEAEAQGRDPMEGFGHVQRIEDHMAMMEELSAAAESLGHVKTQLRNSFVAQVQGQLSTEQLDFWPSLDRALVRKKTLPLGRLDGERLDLIRMIEARRLDEDRLAAISETLEEYELALHAALVQRNDYVERSQPRIDAAIRENDPDEAIKIAERDARLRVAVREVNRQFAEILAGRLADEAESFRAEVLEAAHPRVYRRTAADKAFAKAAALDGLDEQTLARVAELKAAFDNERAMLDERLRAAIIQHQPSEMTRALEHLGTIMDGGAPGMPPGFDPGPDPVRAAFRDRREAAERYMNQLYALLPPEQVGRLPKLPSEQRPFVIKSRGIEQ